MKEMKLFFITLCCNCLIFALAKPKPELPININYVPKSITNSGLCSHKLAQYLNQHNKQRSVDSVLSTKTTQQILNDGLSDGTNTITNSLPSDITYQSNQGIINTLSSHQQPVYTISTSLLPPPTSSSGLQYYSSFVPVQASSVTSFSPSSPILYPTSQTISSSSGSTLSSFGNVQSSELLSSSSSGSAQSYSPSSGSSHSAFVPSHQTTGISFTSGGPTFSASGVTGLSSEVSGISSTGLSQFSTGSSSSSSTKLHAVSSSSSSTSSKSSLINSSNQGKSITTSNNGNTVEVTKHIYVHVPPSDPLDEIKQKSKQQQYLSSLTKTRKHYKIIFIKAPTQEYPSTSEILANTPRNEEKTLVYVLVKKPDEPQIEEIQELQKNYEPSKPEVYFIKYKTRTDKESSNNNNIVDNHHYLPTSDITYQNSISSSITNNAELSNVITPPPSPSQIYESS